MPFLLRNNQHLSKAYYIIVTFFLQLLLTALVFFYFFRYTTHMEELLSQRKALYEELQKLEKNHKRTIKNYRMKRQRIGNEIEEIKGKISSERGTRDLYLAAQAPLAVVDTNDLTEWLRTTYAGSDALASIAAAQVRKDYEKHIGRRVRVMAFKRAMFKLGFENKVVRVVNGGGYVTRAWVRSTSP